MVNYKESEYHYGSDFDESEPEYEDDVEEEKESESSDPESSNDEDSDDLVESDVDWNASEAQNARYAESRSVTPIPFWLKTPDEETIPDLKLPKSSDDLLIGKVDHLHLISEN